MCLFSRLLIAALILTATLFAQSINQLELLNTNGGVWDITPQSGKSGAVPKQYIKIPAILKEVEKIVAYFPRYYGYSECRNDKNGEKYCPLLLENCRLDYEYTNGRAIKVDNTAIYDKVRISIGRIGNNYWRGWCKIYKVSTKLYIDNINNINSFKLKQTRFDDYIKVTVNGHVVRVGPYGGDRLEIVKKTRRVLRQTYTYSSVKYSSNRYGKCELERSWTQNHNIDVKPYLKNGYNTIEIAVEVAGKGEGYAYFEAVTKKGNIVCKTGYCGYKDIGDVKVGSGDSYYIYTCPNETNKYGYNWKVKNSGGKGYTSPTPPSNNCSRAYYRCASGNGKCVNINGAWKCSSLSCNSENRCGYAYCKDGYSPSSNSFIDSKYFPISSANIKTCIDNVCDLAVSKKVSYCLKYKCPSGFEVFQKNGRCYKYECKDGSRPDSSGNCNILDCPDGYIEKEDGKCYLEN